MQKQIFLFLLAFFTSAIAFSQSTITGRVVDAETKLPLEGASVFAQNTTIGAITNAEGVFKLQLGKGGYEIIFSFTGYNSERVNVETSEPKQLEIELKKEDVSLSEVVITSSNEVADGWEKYGEFFLDHFIGSTPNAAETTLENPEALKFFYYKRSDKLKVFASEPLKIKNLALGYDLLYSLDSFVFYYGSKLSSYRGSCLYIPIEDSARQSGWKEARSKAYFGSRLHFMRSYYDSSLKKEGYTVDLLSKRTANKFERLINPYDTSYYLVDSLGDVDLWFPTKASITYTKQKPESEYLEQMGLPADVKLQISYVDLADAILIKSNGYFFDQKSWINQGYWSWKNLADQLPYDYDPEQ
jgi:hypothetical protein